MISGDVAGHEAQEFGDKDVGRDVNFSLDTKLKFLRRRLFLGGLFLCGLLDLQLLYTDWADFMKNEMVSKKGPRILLIHDIVAITRVIWHTISMH